MCDGFTHCLDLTRMVNISSPLAPPGYKVMSCRDLGESIPHHGMEGQDEKVRRPILGFGIHKL